MSWKGPSRPLQMTGRLKHVSECSYKVVNMKVKLAICPPFSGHWAFCLGFESVCFFRIKDQIDNGFHLVLQLAVYLPPPLAETLPLAGI